MKFRSPNAMVYTSKELSWNGKSSPFPQTQIISEEKSERNPLELAT